MNKSYKSVLCVLIAVSVVTALFLCKTSAVNIFGELFSEMIIQTSAPSYAFVANVDNICETTLFQAVLNDIYPMNDYILSNENTSQQTVLTYTENVIETENVSEAAPQEEPAEEPESGTAAEDVKSSENESNAQDVISRNIITGKTFEKSQLSDYSFVHGSFYTVTSITELTNSILRPAEFIEKDLSIEKDSSKPQILIFHTHSQETFADSVEGDTSTSIVGVGDYLTQLLTARGYNVIHDTEVYDYVDGKLDRSKAYTYAENGIDSILSEYPSIEVVIDLHRDGVAETTHLVTEVDGKQMAKIMFFNGLSYSRLNGDIDYLYNPYRDDNLSMSLQMQLLGEAYYPGFLRNIYVNAYRYCLHKRARSMLIEAGAQTNTVQEVKNAMEPLADLLDKFLSGEKVY
jgi:stage II sporulation protein P